MVRKRGKLVRARRPFFNFFSSLRASSLWHSGGGAGKGRRACKYVSELWISASKGRCEMLVGEGDISSDVIILCSCFSMFVYIRARFRFALIGRNLKAQSTGSHRELEVEFKFQRRCCKHSFLFPPRFWSAPESFFAGYFSLAVSSRFNPPFPKQRAKSPVLEVSQLWTRRP